MNKRLQHILAAILLLSLPSINFAQGPTLGAAADFVLFSTNGAVSNSGISQLTGKVGTNNGSSTFFGNVNGQMHDGDTVSAQAATDLLIAYNYLDTITADFFPSTSLGGGQTLVAGVYSISASATLTSDLTLNAQGDSNAIFIIQINGALSTASNSKVKLINDAMACNVFWKVEGLVSMASGTSMKGTVIANNAAINMSTADTLEGRALSIAGAVSVDGVMAYTPTGCGSPINLGPTAPNLGRTSCYGIFSSDGPVTNSGSSTISGDVGTNVGLTTGFNPLTVSGTIHPIPDTSTANAAADLLIMNNYVDSLVYDIELLYPAQFGRNLVLTPHTYIMKGATTFTDTLYLNAEGNADAIFVIKINGALSTTAYSKVILTNGTKAKNVFWKVDGAVDISDYSEFKGNIIANNGAIDLATGVKLHGRAFTTTGAIETTAITTSLSDKCVVTGINSITGKSSNDLVEVYPNPFGLNFTIKLNEQLTSNYNLKMYNALGKEVMNSILSGNTTTLETSELPSGIYFYQVLEGNKIIQSGKLISQQ